MLYRTANLHKLASLGVCHTTLHWIKAFLHDRYQYVILNGSFSSQSTITSGVVQGNVLALTLFNLYANDLPEACPNCSIEQFADDTKSSKQIVKPNDSVILQKSLDALCVWADKHDLKLSLDKCIYLQIGYCDNTITYIMGTRILLPCTTANDLGIAIQSSLKPGMHCTQIAVKANARAKLILKAFLSNDAQSLTRAFTTFVRPILEFVIPVWCPYFKTDINIIENVQRSLTRTLFYLGNFAPTNYDNRLKRFGLQRLERRHIIHDLRFMFKLTHGQTDCNLHHAIRYSPNVGTKGHCYKLYVACTCTQVNTEYAS